ncbi:MAG: rod shape-determining protein MreC [bacterium]|nr:rod shape-determining protein MreC [bacterium]
MNFIRKEKNKYLYLFLFVLFLIIGNFYFFGFLKDRFYSFFYESIYKTFQAWNFNNEYKQEIDSLRAENEKLISIIGRLQEIEKENLTLKEINKIKNFAETEKVLANPLFVSDKGVIVLNAGSEQNIKEKMSVINKDGYFCGWINRITENFSYLKMLLAIDFKIPVKISSLEKTEAGFVEGVLERKNNSFLITLIPHDKEIKVGDLVFTKSFMNKEILISDDILIGKVVSAKKDDASSFQEIEISISCGLEENYLILLNNYGEI